MKTGLDPEVLVMCGNEVVAAERFLEGPGDSDTPRPISYDNAAIEMRPDASESPHELRNNLSELFRLVDSSFNKARFSFRIPFNSNIDFRPAGSLRVYDRTLKSVARFGCSPSLLLTNEYTTKTVVPCQSADSTYIRSAGFHVHQEIPNLGTCQVIVAALDGLLGLRDVLMNEQKGWSPASRLRRLHLGYGRAGEHRIRTQDGVQILEYRTLSPWPLMHPKMAEFVINTTRAVASYPLNVIMSALADFPDRSDITAAINDATADNARPMLRQCQKAWQEATHNAGRLSVLA